VEVRHLQLGRDLIVALQVEYDLLFNDTTDIDNRFDDGAFFYTLGVGFNFPKTRRHGGLEPPRPIP